MNCLQPGLGDRVLTGMGDVRAGVSFLCSGPRGMIKCTKKRKPSIRPIMIKVARWKPLIVLLPGNR
jgi:hypothetical protein